MKRSCRIASMLVAALLVGVAGMTAGATEASATTDADRIARGFKIAPVPLKLAGLDRNLVGLGSYIVNSQGACLDCHTNPPYAVGGDPFLGQPKRVNKARYMAGGTPFGPGLFSANLTPDAQGRPAGLTLGEFVNAIRTGRDPDNASRLLQVMPWPVYQDMRYDDLKAIYTYLRAIPSIAGPP